MVSLCSYMMATYTVHADTFCFVYYYQLQINDPSYIMYFSTHVALSSYSPLVPMCIQGPIFNITQNAGEQYFISKIINTWYVSI